MTDTEGKKLLTEMTQKEADDIVDRFHRQFGPDVNLPLVIEHLIYELAASNLKVRLLEERIGNLEEKLK